MKTTKINIGVALSRNYDKISLELLDEPIEYETEEQLKELVKKKFAFLKKAVVEEFDTEKPKEEKPVEKASDKQLSYLESLGFEGETKDLTKVEATQLIKELLETPPQAQNY